MAYGTPKKLIGVVLVIALLVILIWHFSKSRTAGYQIFTIADGCTLNAPSARPAREGYAAATYENENGVQRTTDEDLITGHLIVEQPSRNFGGPMQYPFSHRPHEKGTSTAYILYGATKPECSSGNAMWRRYGGSLGNNFSAYY